MISWYLYYHIQGMLFINTVEKSLFFPSEYTRPLLVSWFGVCFVSEITSFILIGYCESCFVLYLWYLFFFNWSIHTSIDVQYWFTMLCVSFWYTAQWFRDTHTHTHTHTHTYSFSHLFPLWFITGYSVCFHLLYSRSVLFISFIYTVASVC